MEELRVPEEVVNELQKKIDDLKNKVHPAPGFVIGKMPVEGKTDSGLIIENKPNDSWVPLVAVAKDIDWLEVGDRVKVTDAVKLGEDDLLLIRESRIVAFKRG